MGRKSRNKKLKGKEIKGYSRFKILSSVLFLVLILSVLSLLTISSYLSLRLPLVPKAVVRATDITIASIKFLPKTPKQVITRAFFEMGRIKSGEHNFSLELVENPGSGNEKIILSPKVFGPFKRSVGQIDLAAEINLGFPSEDQGSSSKINFVESEDYLYFQVKNLPSFQNLDLSKLGSGWHKVDMTKIASDAKASIRSDEDIEQTIKEKTKLLFDSLATEHIFQKISVLPDEKTNTRDTFHYTIVLGEEDIKKIMAVFFSEEGSLQLLTDLSLDIFIDKSKFYFNKLEIKGLILKDSISSSSAVLNTPELGFKLIYELSKVNEDVEIGLPQDAIEIGSLFGLYLLVQGEEAEDGPAGLILGAATSLGEFGANFLTLERLLHVLYLAPSSF